jgi:hypothetical protein
MKFILDRRMLLKKKVPRFARIMSLFVLAAVLGSVDPVYAKRGGRLELEIVDDQTGQPVACRVHIDRVMPGPKARARRIPQKVKGLPFLGDHFVCPGRVALDLAEGNYEFEIERGPEYPITSGHFRIETFADDKKTVRLRRFVDMAAEGWWSGDLGVMRPVDQIELLMLAEDLHLTTVLTWTNETGWAKKTAVEKARNQISPIGSFDSKVVRFHNDYYYRLGAGRAVWPGGQLGHYLREERLNFSDGVLATLQKGKDPSSWTEAMAGSILALPVLVARGQVDSVRIAGESMEREKIAKPIKGTRPAPRKLFPPPRGSLLWDQAIYFHLLNCGLRIPPSAGSGSGIGGNPVGYNRNYVFVDGRFTYESWWEAFRAGRVVVTNGPLLRPTVGGEKPGAVFKVEGTDPVEFEIGLTLSVRQPISYLEIIKNGKVDKTISFAEYAKSGKLPKIRFDGSGWFLIRATTDLEKTYRFAMTGPYYVEFDYRPRISRASVQFFLDWIDQIEKDLAETTLHQEKGDGGEIYKKTLIYWENLLKKANAK